MGQIIRRDESWITIVGNDGKVRNFYLTIVKDERWKVKTWIFESEEFGEKFEFDARYWSYDRAVRGLEKRV